MRFKGKKKQVSLSFKIRKKYKSLTAEQLNQIIQNTRDLFSLDFGEELPNTEKLKIFQSAIAMLSEYSNKALRTEEL